VTTTPETAQSELAKLDMNPSASDINWQDPKTWIVLVVDDERDNLEVVAESLEFNGAVTKTAKNGAAAIEMLQTFKPNIILMDLSMPVMDGWETRRRIKDNPETQHIPILALSAHAMSGDKERAIAAGFDGYLTKPINVLTLAKDIRKAANKDGDAK
jgi:two-component system, cell cycle response regulator DivK